MSRFEKFMDKLDYCMRCKESGNYPDKEYAELLSEFGNTYGQKLDGQAKSEFEEYIPVSSRFFSLSNENIQIHEPLVNVDTYEEVQGRRLAA